MSELENPHYHRKAGYAMIMVAASLAAIGLMHITIGEDVLFADTIQREKTQTFEEYKLYEGFFWQPHKVMMMNHQNGKSSVLKFQDVKLNNGFTDKDFSQNSLRRSR